MVDFRRSAVEALLKTDPDAGLALLTRHLRTGHLADFTADLIETGQLEFKRPKGRPPGSGGVQAGFRILRAVESGMKVEAALAEAMETGMSRTAAHAAYQAALEYQETVDLIERDQ